MSYLKRMFDAPQRIVLFNHLEDTSLGPAQLRFDIQGLEITRGTATETFSYLDMVDLGIARYEVPALTTWQRLKRIRAPVGTQTESDSNQLTLTFWSDPELIFKLDREIDEHETQWRQLLGLIRAAGFTVRKET